MITKFVVKFTDGNVFAQTFSGIDLLGDKNTSINIQPGKDDAHSYFEIIVLGKRFLFVPLSNVEYYYTSVNAEDADTTEKPAEEEKQDNVQ